MTRTGTLLLLTLAMAGPASAHTVVIDGGKVHLRGELVNGGCAVAPDSQNMRIDMKLLAPCIALGLSAFIMQSTESIISVCFNSSLLKYGGDIAVGAMTILTSVMQFAMLPLQGLTQGAQPGRGRHTADLMLAGDAAEEERNAQLGITVHQKRLPLFNVAVPCGHTTSLQLIIITYYAAVG